MLRMPSGVLMKSLVLGPSGKRTLTFLTREAGEAGPYRTYRRDETRRAGFGPGVPPYLSARAAVISKDLRLLEVNSIPPSFLFGHGSQSFYQRCKGSMMAHSGLKQSAAVALDQSLGSVDDMEKFTDIAHKMADAAGDIIRQLFRTKIDIVDKDDLSPVTIADRRAEHAMSLLINQHFPSHGIYGEESGLQMPEAKPEYIWVLDPIDGTKSFITGKPLFGTLIALVHKGVPILGIIDQPVLRERWVGVSGKTTTLNGDAIASRSSTSSLKDAYMYTTSPHLFAGSKVEAFNRVRDKVKTPLYGCDCYAYGLLAAGHVDLVVESGLKPYDFLALVPVIEGAGGYITDWEGQSLKFWPNSDYPSVGEEGTEIAAAGSLALHKAALEALGSK